MSLLLEAANAELFYLLRQGKGKYFWRHRRQLIVSYYQHKFGSLPARFEANYMTLGRGFCNGNTELSARLFLKRNKVHR